MNTRKHLKILYNLTSILLALSVVGTIVCFIPMIIGEGAAPFLICAILSLSIYFSMVFFATIIDFYDSLVFKPQMKNSPNADTTTSQKNSVSY